MLHSEPGVHRHRVPVRTYAVYNKRASRLAGGDERQVRRPNVSGVRVLLREPHLRGVGLPAGFVAHGQRSQPCATNNCTTSECCRINEKCSDTACAYGNHAAAATLGDVCAAASCTDSECCVSNPTCADVNVCTAGTHASSSTLPCAGVTCTAAECCVANPLCSQSVCAQGASLSGRSTPCATGTCTVSECCVATTCASTSANCGGGYTLVASPATAVCASPNCTRDECCTANPTCQASDCSSDYVRNSKTSSCNELACTQLECCTEKATCQPNMCAGSALSVHQVRNTFVGNCVGASCTFDECCTENSDGDDFGDNAWDYDDADDKDAKKVLRKLEDALDSYGCVGTGTGACSILKGKKVNGNQQCNVYVNQPTAPAATDTVNGSWPIVCPGYDLLDTFVPPFAATNNQAQAADLTGVNGCLTQAAYDMSLRPNDGGKSIWGPLEGEFTSAQFPCLRDNVIPAGLDTETVESELKRLCPYTQPPPTVFQHCAGESGNMTDRMKCLSTVDQATGHSTKVATMADGRPMYGPYTGMHGSKPTDLDACGGRFGVTPDSNGWEIYYYVLQENKPFTIGCFGPATYTECVALYPACSDDDNLVDVGHSPQTQIRKFCPCHEPPPPPVFGPPQTSYVTFTLAPQVMYSYGG